MPPWNETKQQQQQQQQQQNDCIKILHILFNSYNAVANQTTELPPLPQRLYKYRMYRI